MQKEVLDSLKKRDTPKKLIYLTAFVAIIVQTFQDKSLNDAPTRMRTSIPIILGRSAIVMGLFTVIFLIEVPSKIPIEGEIIICSEIDESEIKRKGLGPIEKRINDRNEAVRKKMQTIQNQ